MKKLYHFCLSSGNEVMFRCEEDFIRAFNCYAVALHYTDSQSLADALMTNHFHGCAYSADIRGLIYGYRSAYSRYFNSKYHRKGAFGEKYPFIIDVVGTYHRLSALSYVKRNPLHHGVVPTPFAYRHSSANAIFRKELGKEDVTDLLDRRHCYRYLPRRAEIPQNYKMASNGLLLRESVMDVEQVEYFYGSPRNYLFYMNRLSGEEWDREQEKEGGELITLDKIETGISLQELSVMKRNELGRENYSVLSDMMLCMHIDHEILPRYGVQSVYQLTEQQKKEIGNTLWQTLRARRDQIVRCLAML